MIHQISIILLRYKYRTEKIDRYPALVSEVHLIGYASYFNKKSNLSSELTSRNKKTHL